MIDANGSFAKDLRKNIGSRSRPDTVSRFPDVEYPEEMAHYPNVPLRIGLPNIIEGSINDIPIQGEGLTMGMENLTNWVSLTVTLRLYSCGKGRLI